MLSTENGKTDMQIIYNPKTDILCIRLDEPKQNVVNQRVSDDVALDMGANEKIVGIEINGCLPSHQPEKYFPC